ncbi:MAG TPA: FAD-dependent oxidoreductase [Acidimicrobiales bacterium]|nr:FAD-dependent oxidoreductase [Acidimicrobiales bacterium]
MVMRTGRQWDQTADVIVVGSGGAALTAALSAADSGAEVLVVEKEDVVGGTTGVSGGVLWVPNNDHLAEAGLTDTREDALSYIRRIADGRALDDSLIEVFVDTAPEMLRYLEAKTPLRMQLVTNLPDYYVAIRDRIPGCQPFSRSVEPVPYPARDELGEWADRIAARSTLLSLGATTTLVEDLAAMGGVSANLDELARREREGIRVKGAALVACLLKGLLDRGVRIQLSSPARDLVVDDDGAVVGLAAGADGGTRLLGARRGVILACGGFEWNRDMVLGYLGYDVQPLSPGGNTGDGHLMAMEAGALMGNMWGYWGQGAMFDPAVTLPDGRPAAQMMTGLGPGSVIVNGHGRRFMHGGYTYNDFPKPFGNFDQDYPGFPNRPPGWVIFGASVKERQPILTMRPGEPAPEWLAQADTVRELAERIGIDPDVLEETVNRFNEHAGRGEDPDWNSPMPRPVEGPPYYAIEQWPASLGTNGGCRINADGQVLGHRRTVIDGLYAAGNTSAAVLGGAYVGGGTPICSGATFGLLAGRHAASQTPRSV